MALTAPHESDDDDLESPSSLWAAVSGTPRRNPTRSRPLGAKCETPTRPQLTSRRTSPRFVKFRTLEKTPPSVRATPSARETSERARRVEPKLSDSAERRRRLADELFPPSPPASNGSPANEAQSDAETEWVADSEVEREDEERRAAFDRDAEALQSPASSLRPVLSTTEAMVKARRLLDSASLSIDATGTEEVLALASCSDDEAVLPDSQAKDRERFSPAPAEPSSLEHRLERLQLSLDQLQPANPPFVKPVGASASTPSRSRETPRAVPSGKTPRSRRQKEVSQPSDTSEHASPSLRSPSMSTLSPSVQISSRDDQTVATTTPSQAGVADRRMRSAATPSDDGFSVCCRVDDEPLSGGTDASPAKLWPDDVIENDGVLIYDPTPKKRPVKLPRARPTSASPRDTPSTSTPKTVAADKPSAGYANTATLPALGAKSKLRVELDLTGDSSEEDVAQRRETHASSSDDDLPSPTYRRHMPPSGTFPIPARRTAPRLPLPPAPRTPASKSGKRRSGLGAASSTEKRLTPTDRSTLPLALIRDLDRAVFRKRWHGLRIVSDAVGDGLPEGIEVVWNARLRNTAGRASWKTSKKTTTVDGVSTTTTTHHAMVELSTKVTDTAAKLRHTLAHELCHLATWAIDGEMKPPHGAAFKLWAKRVMLVRPDIEVTTTHSYEIEYKYRWKCVSAVCGKIFGRHSASIDPATHGCPCGARIVPIDKDGLPKPGYSIVTATGTIVATPKSERKKSKWVEFLQSESPVVRKQNPTLSQPEIFKVVAERWKFAKEKAAADAERVAASVDDTGDLDIALDSLRL
ncbi:hypothetical protein BMF94_0811 [Rhodotorula taiwanensis]|uniref:SprT-like domain-containing protein n=1 Tax=Rhodotorula taiwanensis TaxID=741276 RepID=A0A2S5BH30_9BASI|nr:hypothetical protein BMF94_0811 [Rhodotorula taiwanensis]